ncbi:MAG: hypothetical protein AAF411_28415, partial [Myxococcota bacterium]
MRFLLPSPVRCILLAGVAAVGCSDGSPTPMPIDIGQLDLNIGGDMADAGVEKATPEKGTPEMGM